MTREQIQTIGVFLMYYKADLNYIKMFRNFCQDKISDANYVKKGNGTFYSFLVEFKIIRTFKKGTTDKLLWETLKFINTKYSTDVDLFADWLVKEDITRNRLISLASKILFLNNPWDVIPMDKNGKKALRQKENDYSEYKVKLEQFREKDKSVIEECLNYINPLAVIIEDEFKRDIKNLQIIRENRVVDKLLWTAGNNGFRLL